ncbi:MAG: hypothetical protein KF755_14870 [Burkholderiaceae bacterium]|nr:hypothetical protein [Burkholderiaceae bacterium]
MRLALGRIAAAVHMECEQIEAEQRPHGVPQLLVEIAELVESVILRSEELPSRGATVAAPVFAILRRAAKGEQKTTAAIPLDAFGLPREGHAAAPGALSSPIAEALAWLDEEHVRKAFIRTGAPYARAWLRDALEWARTNPEAQPPRLPDSDPLAPPPEQGELQPGASKRGRPKGSIDLSSKTRDLALLVLYLTRVKGLSLDTAKAWVRTAGPIAPDRSGLRRACEELESVDISTDVLELVASAVAERYRLPVDFAPDQRSAPHPRDAGQ